MRLRRWLGHAGELRRRMVDACSRALRRLAADAWPLLQRTAAAVAAWAIARYGVGHPEPFFAPIAAVVALNASLGERGLNAVRMLLGVVVGIVAAELAISALGGGLGPLALATFAAMAVARTLGSARIVTAQAASSAILTVVVANGEAGPQRLVDALVGAGVALVFSQLLFPPEPVALMRHAEAAALTEMAKGLALAARALEHDNDELVERSMSSLRDLRDRLVELDHARRASSRVALHSLIWRSRLSPVRREKENADRLNLLGGSCLMLTRTALATGSPERRKLASSVRELAGVLADLATELSDRRTGQRAADAALAVAHRLAISDPSAEPTLATPIVAVRMVAADVMAFAGVAPGQVDDGVPDGKSSPRPAADA
ncbi:MAG: FUSC family protein [Actinomycetota bacterium]|nr:FUSC family protein [Actinomycetota bacterium]